MTDFTVTVDSPTALAAPSEGATTSEHPIARLGSFKDPRYGTFSITKQMFESWLRNLRESQNGRVAIDYDHQAERAGGSTKAAGWITNLRLEADKVIASIEWTPSGAESVRNKDYLFVSPSFVSKYRDESGVDKGPTLVGVALTNRAFLKKGMPALSLSKAAEGDFAEPENPTTLESVLAEVEAQVARMPEEQRRGWEQVLTRAHADLPNDDRAEHLDVTLAELEADHRALDRVVRAVSLNANLDYVAALEKVTEEWPRQAAIVGDPSEARLSQILTAGGLTLDAIRRDVDKFSLAEQQADEAIQLNAPTEAPEGEVNALSQVLLAEGVDRARLIADEVELERAFLEACELEPGVYEVNRDRFVEDFKRETRAGVDLIGTLKHQRRAAEIQAATRRAEVAQLGREDRERSERAAARETERKIAELRGS